MSAGMGACELPYGRLKEMKHDSPSRSPSARPVFASQCRTELGRPARNSARRWLVDTVFRDHEVPGKRRRDNDEADVLASGNRERKWPEVPLGRNEVRRDSEWQGADRRLEIPGPRKGPARKRQTAGQPD